jgi:hypothetical protein
MTNNPLQKGIEKYHEQRDDNDIDLIAEVRAMLVSCGLLVRVIEAYDSNRFIIDGTDKAPDVQRFLLNRYWSHQLMCSSKPSIEERSFLIPDGEYKDWLLFFKEKILPFVIENSLPTNSYV